MKAVNKMKEGEALKLNSTAQTMGDTGGWLRDSAA